MEPLLPERPAHPLGCHNPRVPDRVAMNAILLVLRTGMQWNALSATGEGRRRVRGTQTARGRAFAAGRDLVGAYRDDRRLPTTARLFSSRQTLLERISPMLCEQPIVMHAEFGALDHGALARPTVPQQRSTARKPVHEEMVTRAYVCAREAEPR
jgi:hypothetical protein